jgi:hypothetical protein
LDVGGCAGRLRDSKYFDSPLKRQPETASALDELPRELPCAVRRHGLPVGANPTRQLSLRPVAIGAVVEVTKRLKPSM